MVGERTRYSAPYDDESSPPKFIFRSDLELPGLPGVTPDPCVTADLCVTVGNSGS